MDFGIKGKHALVCAASRGLGFAIAKALAEEGVNLIISARDSEKLNQAAETIRELAKVKVDCIAGDLSIAADRQKLIDFTKEKAAGVDILVHNVGGPKAQAAQSTSSADWQEAFDKLFLPIVELNQTPRTSGRAPIILPAPNKTRPSLPRAITTWSLRPGKTAAPPRRLSPWFKISRRLLPAQPRR